MPRQKVTHWNPPATNGKTRCGFKLREGGWVTDAKDVTCDRCLACMEADAK